MCARRSLFLVAIALITVNCACAYEPDILISAPMRASEPQGGAPEEMYDADEEVQFYREHPELRQDSGSEPQGGAPEEMYDADEEVQFYREHPELLDGILAS